MPSAQRHEHGDGQWSVPPGLPVPSAAPNAVDRRSFVHTAVSYRSTEELVGVLAPVVQGWLTQHDRIFVSLASDRVDALRSALGEDADRVRWSDTYHWAPHPARRLRAIQDLVEGEERHGSGQLRFVGEWAFTVGPPELVSEWERVDAVLNEALGDSSLTMVCTYDVGSPAEGVVERVSCTHPFVGVDPVFPSEGYRGSLEYLTPPAALSPLPSSATRETGRPTPADVRSLVRRVLGATGGVGPVVPPVVVDDLAVVATEVVTNAWQVGAQSIDVACWRTDDEAGVQVDDDGPGLEDAFAGYRRPEPALVGGRGLWIARQLADLVEIAANGTGTSVRARTFRRPEASER